MATCKLKDRDITRYARTLREARDRGFSLDILMEVALGADALQPSHEGLEREIVRDLYRESLPASLTA